MARRPAPDKQQPYYLSEDEIVAEIVGKVRASPEAVALWGDPWSWREPPSLTPQPNVLRMPAPDSAGCLIYTAMAVRNSYRLWDKFNPYSGEYLDDPAHENHPDNMSARIVERARAELRKPQEKPDAVDA